jgi:hypothetical protein
MPRDATYFGKTLVMTSHSPPPPERLGGFCSKKSSNNIKAGDLTTSGNP